MKKSMPSKLQYNERSWAIDLISAINKRVSSGENIQRASGEFSLGGSGKTLFPDVILFGNASNGSILQGWELKMPDTAIDDTELLNNAAEKARRLGLNSFLVWNAVYADLYLKDDADCFVFYERLHENSKIFSRSDVANHQDLWLDALKIIIDKLNNFFRCGIIAGIDAGLLFGNGDFIENILRCQANIRLYIERVAQKDNRLKAKIDSWWKYVSESYPDENPYSPLAYSILLRWINRFVFANILKTYNQKDVPANLKHGMTIKDCIQLFSSFSKTRNVCNFFQPTEFDDLIPAEEWELLLSFNEFLNSIEFSKISESVLSSILHATTLSSIKNAAGLFVTPEALAYLLVYLALRDKTEHSIDPFCGTGTIVNAMMAIKTEDNIPGATVLETTWGSDKFAFPIQVAAMAMFSPENIGRLMKIFTSDVLSLKTGKGIKFIDPASGKETIVKLPLFSVIVSNLPFINSAQIPELNAAVWDKITSFYGKYKVDNEIRLSQRSDFYAYMPFVLYDLLASNGTLGIITSNSWLSTEWGVNYRMLLRKFYNIDYVLVSANGRWFKSADVVSTILVCSKKEKDNVPNDTGTVFVSTKQALDDVLFDPQDMATSILVEDSNNPNVAIRRWTDSQLDEVEKLGLGWTALFSDLSWFLDNRDKFMKLNNICDVVRGERRGWDAMFILSPSSSKQLDKKFLTPYLKNINGHYGLTIGEFDSFAFVCLLSPEDLKLPENISAKKWIDSFAKKNNKAGKPLTTSLKIANGEWYQFKIKAYADFVLPLNPDTRLYTVRTLTKTALNQRLICLSLKKNYENDIAFIHALLNSTVSMLMIEMLGFGRGLGVLDITSTKIKTGFWIFDPSLFTKDARSKVIDAFMPLLKRKVKAVPEEINEEDRRLLDKTILSEIGIDYSIYGNKIYDSLLNLYNIRKSVT